MEELKRLIQDYGRTFEAYKTENDKAIKEMQTKGIIDPVLAEKEENVYTALVDMSTMKTQLEAIETAIARSQLPGGANSQEGKAVAEHAKAFKNWMKTGVDTGLRELEVKAEMSTLSDPDGGFLTSDPVKGKMREVLSLQSRMRELANIQTISSDEYKTLVDQHGESSEDVTEKGTRSTTDTPTFREVSIFVKEMSAKPKVTQTMLDDPAFDTESFVGKFLGRTFAAREGTWFWEGDGVKQAKGINTYPKIANTSYTWGYVGYVYSGHATLLNKADTLIELQHALKPGYRAGAKFMMNDNTILAIRKLKDGEGNYLWRPGLQENAPDTLLGKPIVVDDYVDDIGAGKYPIWFANWAEAYTIVDRFGIRMLRDPYSSKPYVEFYTTKKTGGGIVMYEAIKCLKIHTS
ncbi:MAG: phage major capsid protein [Methanomicrobium sp.]|nr:phage major capsid protein [Methanomicrobium sp.]